MGGLLFLHLVTKKGQGYKLTEADPVLYHGPGKFDPSVGIQKSKAPAKQTFTQVFGHWLCDMAQADGRLVGITPAMREGSGLVEFEQRFPTRYFDVGIAEQHAVRSEEHTSELQSLMRSSYAVFCLKKKK